MIGAGKLDRRVSLLRPTTETNDMGEETSSFSVLATVWAAKEALRFTDVQRAQTQSISADAKFVIRWRDDVTNDMRLRFEGDDYSVIAVEEIGRRVGLSLLVRVG